LPRPDSDMDCYSGNAVGALKKLRDTLRSSFA
jgi:hypothetical protein